jgi:hypothetical protein
MDLTSQDFNESITVVKQHCYFSLLDKKNNMSFYIDGNLYSFKDENGICWKSACEGFIFGNTRYDASLGTELILKNGSHYIFTTPEIIMDKAYEHFSKFIKRKQILLQCYLHFFTYGDLAWREKVLTFGLSQINYNITFN